MNMKHETTSSVRFVTDEVWDWDWIVNVLLRGQKMLESPFSPSCQLKPMMKTVGQM